MHRAGMFFSAQRLSRFSEGCLALGSVGLGSDGLSRGPKAQTFPRMFPGSEGISY